jgi:phage-related protein
MTHPNSTYQVTTDLDNYLKSNNYFDGQEEATINQKILDLWDLTDIKSAFDNVEVDFLLSEFKLTSTDHQGACLFFHKVILSDKATLEFIKAFIKTLVNYNKTTIYLDSSHATADQWQGKSKKMKTIFDKLKTADKQIGYFNPISLADFTK